MDFGFINGFVILIGEIATLFRFIGVLLECALVFKGLHILGVAFDEEYELLCFALVKS